MGAFPTSVSRPSRNCAWTWPAIFARRCAKASTRSSAIRRPREPPAGRACRLRRQHRQSVAGGRLRRCGPRYALGDPFGRIGELFSSFMDRASAHYVETLADAIEDPERQLDVRFELPARRK